MSQSRSVFAFCAILGTCRFFCGPMATGADGDLNGNRTLECVAAPVVQQGEKAPFYRATWAIFIGLDHYENGLGDVDYQVNAASAIRQRLCRDYGYAAHRVHFLDDERAKRKAIEEAFSIWLPSQQIEENDSLLVFYAGHGKMDGNKGYLAAYNSQHGRFENTWIGVSWLTEQLARVKCKHKLLIINSCFSGALFLDKQSSPPLAATSSPSADVDLKSVPGPNTSLVQQTEIGPGRKDDNLQKYLDEPFFWGITAGRLTQVDAGSGGHSPFIAAILKVLDEQGDSLRAKDHIFGIRKCVGIIEEQVVNATNNSFQRPDSGPLGPGRGDFLFRPTTLKPTPSEEAKKNELSAHDRLVRLFVSSANQRLDGQEPLSSLPYFSAALGLDQAKGENQTVKERLRLHALRLSMISQQTRRHELRQFWNLDSKVNDATFSTDGSLVVTAHLDGTVQVWSATTGLPVLPTLRHRGGVNAVSFSPDGRLLATACQDGTARLWNATSGAPAASPFRHEAAVVSVRFSPDSGFVVTASSDGTARVWDAAKGIPVTPLLEHSPQLIEASFSAKGDIVASVAGDQAVRLWVAKSGKPFGDPIKYDGFGRFASFSSKTNRLVTPALDGGAQVWDVASTGLIAIGSVIKHEDSITYASLSANGDNVVTASKDGTAQVWHAYSGKRVGPPLKHFAPLTYAAFSPSGSQIVTISQKSFNGESVVNVWDVNSNTTVTPPLRTGLPVSKVMFGPDGRQLLMATGEFVITPSKRPAVTDEVRIWNVGVDQLTDTALTGRGVLSFQALSPNGRYVITTTPAFEESGKPLGTREAQVWQTSSGKSLGKPIRLEPGWIHGLAVAPDASRVIVTSGLSLGTSEKGMAQIFDTANGEPLTTQLEHKYFVHQATFSSDGRYVATGSGIWWRSPRGPQVGEARVWDAFTGTPVTAPLVHEGSVRQVRISSDGRRLLTLSQAVFVREGKEVDEGRAQMWDIASGKSVGVPAKQSGFILNAAFSPDEKIFATAGSDGLVQVYDVETGEPVLKNPLVHQDRVNYLAFSPDGRWIATASDDRTARVWDASSGALIGAQMAHTDWVDFVAFSPDGLQLATVCGLGSPDAAADESARSIEKGTKLSTRIFQSQLWQVPTGLPVGPLREFSRPVKGANFTNEGLFIVTGTDQSWSSGRGEALIFDAAPGEVDGTLIASASGHTLTSVSFSPDGNRVLTSADESNFGGFDFFLGQLDQGEVRVWDAVTGDPLLPPLKTKRPVTGATFTKNGQHIITISRKPFSGDDSEAQVWNAANGQPLGTAFKLGHSTQVVIEPNFERILTVGRDNPKDTLAQIWEPATGKPSGEPFTQDGGSGLNAVFSADGRYLLSSGYQTVLVRNAATGAPLSSPIAHSAVIHHMALSPGENWLVLASNDNVARVYHTGDSFEAGQAQFDLKRTLEHRDEVKFASFSPKGRFLVTASQDGTAQVWDFETGVAVAPALKHETAVRYAAFSSDGRLVVTIGEDRKVRVWDASSGDPMTPWLRTKNGNWNPQFSPDGRRLLTEEENGAVRLRGLRSLEHNADEWPLLAQIYSGQRLDERGNLVSLEGNSLRRVSQLLRKPGELATHPEDIAAWHHRQAVDSQLALNWESALWHFDRLVEREPTRPAHLVRRAKVQSELGRLPQVVADYEKAIQLGANDWSTWLELSTAYTEFSRAADAEAAAAKAATLGAANWWVQWCHALALAALAESKSLPKAEAEQAREKSLRAYSKVIELEPTFWQARFNRAGLYFKASDWAQADADFSEVIKLEPEVWQAHYRRGQTHAYRNDLVLAVQDYSKALDLTRQLKPSGRIDLQDARARAYIALLQWKNAKADCDEIVQSEPARHSAWINLGITQLQTDDAYGAVRSFKKAIALKPEDWLGWYYRGKGNSQTDEADWPEALVDYTKALELSPPQPEIVFNDRGFLYLKMKFWSGAITDYTNAIQLKPDFVDAWYGRGCVHEAEKRWDDALKDYSEAVRLNPQFAVALAARGLVHGHLKNWPSVIKDCSKAVDLNPQDQQSWNVRALAHSELEQWPESVADYERAIQLQFDDWQSHAGLVRALMKSKAFLQASGRVHFLLTIKTDSPEIFCLAGEVYSALKSWKEAEGFFEKAVTLKPDDAEAWHKRGIAYAGLGDWTAAAKAHAKVLELQPLHVDTRYHLGLVLLELKQYDLAIEEQTQVIAVDARHWKSRFARGRTYFQMKNFRLAADDAMVGMSELLTDSNLWTEYGQHFAESNRWELAAEACSVAVGLGTKKPAVWNLRGVSYFQQGKWSEAAEDFRQALSKGEKGGLVWSNLGYAESALDHQDEAIKCFSNAIELALTTGVPWKGRGAVHVRLKKWHEALEDLSTAIKKGVDDWETWFDLGDTYVALDHPTDAEVAYGNVLKLRPDESNAWRSRGLARARLNRWNEAAEDFNESLIRQPENPLAWYCVALPQVFKGSTEEYQETCAKMLKRFGETDKRDIAADVAFTCTIAPNAVKDFESVLRLAKMASTEEPENYYYAITEGAVLFRAERFIDAIKQLEKATSLKDHAVEAWLLLGLIHKRLNQHTESQGWFEKAANTFDASNKEKSGSVDVFSWAVRLHLELIRQELTAKPVQE